MAEKSGVNCWARLRLDKNITSTQPNNIEKSLGNVNKIFGKKFSDEKFYERPKAKRRHEPPLFNKRFHHLTKPASSFSFDVVVPHQLVKINPAGCRVSSLITSIPREDLFSCRQLAFHQRAHKLSGAVKNHLTNLLALADVKPMRLFGSLLSATRLPLTVRLVPLAKATVVPGEIVRVAPLFTVTMPVTNIALLQVVFVVMVPEHSEARRKTYNPSGELPKMVPLAK
jgi:hypothetical protein